MQSFNPVHKTCNCLFKNPSRESWPFKAHVIIPNSKILRHGSPEGLKPQNLKALNAGSRKCIENIPHEVFLILNFFVEMINAALIPSLFNNGMITRRNKRSVENARIYQKMFLMC